MSHHQMFGLVTLCNVWNELDVWPISVNKFDANRGPVVINPHLAFKRVIGRARTREISIRFVALVCKPTLHI